MAYAWQRYTKAQTLGHGAYGTVYLAKDLEAEDVSEEYVAIKCVPLMDIGERDKQMAMGEVAILRQLEHRNILRFIDCFIDEDSFLCTVTEFVDGGDLAAFHRKATEGQPGGLIDAFVVADLAEQMLEGLSYLHANHVLHRDFKPQNCYITKEGVIKIGDFGVSKLLTASMPQAKTFIGTPFYMAPEVCLSEDYSYPADVWSIGVVLYELYLGKLPFVASNVLALIHAITEGKFDGAALDRRPYSASPSGTTLNADLQADICKLVCSLIKSCLVLDDERRPTAAGLLRDYFQSAGTGTCWAEQDDAQIETVEDWTRDPSFVPNATAPAPDDELGKTEEEILESHQPSWLVDAERLSGITLEIPHSSHSSSSGFKHATPKSPMHSPNVTSPVRHYDPKEIEAKIRERCIVLHRKRLEKELARRQHEMAARAEAKKVEAARRAAETAGAVARLPVVGRPGLEFNVQTSLKVENSDHAQLTSSLGAARNAEGSDKMRDTLKKIAEAIVEQDPTRRKCSELLGISRNAAASAEADDDGDGDGPLRINLIAADRIVPVKGKRGMTYKKLLRRLRKALGMDAEAELPGVLSYQDTDGDDVVVSGRREWSHALQDFAGRGTEVLVLRLQTDEVA
jgi:NIMA (never in mitosis gene a)-related kinase